MLPERDFAPPRATAGGGVLAIVLVALAATLTGVIVARQFLSPAPEYLAASIYPEARRLKPFRLVDSRGAAFTEDALEGQITLLFFGFTNCPDICPDTLGVLARARAKLETMRVDKLPQVVFVSVDPERDRGAAMGEYARYFDPAFRAVTGDDEALTTLTGQVGATWIDGQPDAEGFYTVDHSGMIVIIDSTGRMIGRFPPGADAESIAADLFGMLRAGV